MLSAHYGPVSGTPTPTAGSVRGCSRCEPAPPLRRTPAGPPLSLRWRVSKAAALSRGGGDGVCAPSQDAECGRRQALAALLAPLVSTAAATAMLAPAGAALADESLCGRIDEQSARTPGTARPWAPKQVYYPVRLVFHTPLPNFETNICLGLNSSLHSRRAPSVSSLLNPRRLFSGKVLVTNTAHAFS